MIIITGQTATGKTDLAVKLAKKYQGELVNFDSRQIYKHLNIITGKDYPDVKVWLYDLITPNKYFSSFDFSVKAKSVIKDILKRGKTPILVGGSYFYLKHFLYGFDIPPAPANQSLRKKLNSKSITELQKILKKLSKNELSKMNNSDINNPRRLIRKIEILKNQNQGLSLYKDKPSIGALQVNKFIGLKYKNKNDLVKAIKLRVKKRLKQGAITEVKSLLKKGYKSTDFGLKTIGYQQIIKYLEGSLTLDEAIEEWITKEVQYAKRQYTFMKKDKNIKWKEI